VAPVDERTAAMILQLAKYAARKACALWNCPWARDDVAGEAVVEAIATLGRVRTLDNQGAYLWRVCARTSMKAAMRERATDRQTLPLTDDEVAPSQRDWSDDACCRVWLADTLGDLGRDGLLSKMVALRLQGRSQEEVARHLGVSQSAVSRKLCALRQKLW